VLLSTADWSLTNYGGTTLAIINASMTKWLTGPKSPGLIILEHELSNQSVQAFQQAYPLMVSQGWKLPSVAAINGTGIYLNAMNTTSPVNAVNGVLLSEVNAPTSTPSSYASSYSGPISTTPGSSSRSSALLPTKSGSSVAANGSLRHFVSPGAAVLCLVVALFA
jgi:chitin deacetylase